MDDNTELIRRTIRLLDLIKFPGYSYVVRESHGGVFIQGTYVEPDVHTRVVETQFTRKWLLSPPMTDSEIVSTVFKLCITSMEHRARESFTYKGKRIFGPHFDVERLVQIADLEVHRA